MNAPRRSAPLDRAAIALALVLAGCGSSADSARPAGPRPPIVEVAPVERIAIDEGLNLIGQLEPWESVMLRPETSGVVETIGFREGQEVAQGSVLFGLRDDEQQARVREADAQVVLAERAYDRAHSLAGERILAASELDEATANRSAARARADLARVALERMTIRAPFDGVVGQRMVSPGDRVEQETDLVKLDAVAKLRLAFALPEPVVDLVHVGMPLQVSVVAYPNDSFPGSVYFVAPSLDPQSRHLLLKGEVENPDRRLRPGMFANLRVETDRIEEVVAVPESAVIADPAGAFVYRVTPEGIAERVEVTLGLRRAGKVEVKRGLAAGDRVVSAGTNKVAAGGAIEVSGTPPAGPATAEATAPARQGS